MSPFLLFFALLATVVWVGHFGTLGLREAVLGIAVVGTGLLVLRRLADPGPPLPWRRVPGAAAALLGYVFRVLLPGFIVDSLRVARAALPGQREPAGFVVAVTLPGASPGALLLLALGVTLAPSWQVVEVDEARRILYVHAAGPATPEQVAAAIRDHYERYVRRAVP